MLKLGTVTVFDTKYTYLITKQPVTQRKVYVIVGLLKPLHDERKFGKMHAGNKNCTRTTHKGEKVTKSLRTFVHVILHKIYMLSVIKLQEK